MQNNVGIYASQISGKLWAPAGAYDALATVTLSATTASINFAGIPAGYKHLQLRISGRTVGAYTGDSNTYLYFNGTEASYSHQLYGSGSATGSGNSANSLLSVRIPNDNNSANIFGAGIMDILDYSSTTKNKTVRTLDGWDANGSGYMYLHSVLWNNTSPITSITLTTQDGSWKTGSTIALYGVK
jgi:hypothetical protein